jgi:exonuclease SbcC
MRLENLHIDSFGALAGASFAFQPGLNIILGPNEAGKSTVFEAIRHTLLTPSRLTKKQFQSGLQRFLPAGGGDTIGCTLTFSRLQQAYTLRRQWGSSASSELRLPSGGRLTDEEAIAASVGELLPAPEGTLRSVLLTSQSGLAATLQDLKENRETLYSLSDLLHKALLETDGVSVARLQGLLERRAEEYFEHWDREMKRPEGNRGPGNPYKKGVGRILAAYYELEGLKRLHRETLEQEDAYGSTSRRLEQQRLELTDREGWLQTHQRAVRDARERKRLEAEYRDSRREEQAVREDAELWPALLERKKNLEAELPAVSARRGALTSEKQAAQDFEQSRALRTRLERVREKKRLLEEAEAVLSRCTAPSRAELEKLRELFAVTERLAAGLEGGRVQARLLAKTDLKLSAEIDLRKPEPREAAAGGELSFRADGRIFLDHPDWSLELTSGTGDVRDRAREQARAEEKLRALLKKHRLSSLSEAEKAGGVFEEETARVENARRNLAAELEGDSLEKLELALSAMPGSAPPRPLPDILEELVKTEYREQEIGKQLEETRIELTRLDGDHGGTQLLWEKLGELAARTRELEKSIAALEPLPAGFADAPAFIAAYEEAQAAAEKGRKDAQELELACARLEENMPEESSEEVEIRLREAERSFSGVLEKAEAVARIRAAAEALVVESSQQGGERYGELLASYIRETTGRAYHGMQVKDLLPAGLVRENGEVLPATLLSAGTLDTLTLSLRLAMAELFLTGHEGFLILDDPLVDLDPERQLLAAAALTRFAQNRQLMLFTCHPGQADLFPEGHRLELPRLQR